MTDPRNPFNVQPGQVWMDCDKRNGTRHLLIHAVHTLGTHTGKVLCTSWYPDNQDLSEGRTVWISLRRFKGTSSGCRLLQT